MRNVPPLKREHFQNIQLFENRRALLSLVPKHGIGAEVGVYRGDFSKILLNDALPKRLTLIDIKFPVDVIGYFSQHVKRGIIELVEGDSSTALKKYPDRHFDWIYIDGDHSLAGVEKDAAVAKHKIKEYGLLMFNDYKMGDHNYPTGFFEYGVIDVVNNLCIRERFELIGFAFHPQMYCDVAIKRRKPHTD